ncbi:flagellar hook-associated protein FlgL [Desulfofundulus thermocisternus]|uniref:flagellar hook-associated protein FlgL n=1 Tax=Desulfofundulus thermocisternus TaxID=42471 RepID=UPI00047F9666|nr:flagellar hook-associated protein FlgL [Desulfofundulus thermocisternus]
MRITHMLVARRTQNYIQEAMQRLARTQEQMSTGRRVLRLSDDPPALSQLLNVRTAVERNQQYMRNITDGLSYLDGADTALGTAGELLQKALEYAIQGANGTLEKDDMAAIGEQIDKMIDELVDIANTTVGGKYIFAGTKNDQPPFKREVDNGVDKIYYQGNLERVSREILDQANYPIDVPSVALSNAEEAGVFGRINDNFIVSDGIFDVLIKLRNNLKNGNVAGINDSIGALNAQLDHILRYRVQVGARTSHFESVRSQLQDQEVRLTQVLSNLEDADVARVAVDLSRQQLAYQAALAAGAKILETSLLDYLR